MRSIIYHIAKLLFDALLFSSLSLFMCLYSNVILWEQRYTFWFDFIVKNFTLYYVDFLYHHAQWQIRSTKNKAGLG